MFTESVTAKEMDAGNDLAEKDTQSVIQNQTVKVRVFVGNTVVFSDTYPAAVEGDVTAAVTDATWHARREVGLPLWGWSFSVDKA